MEIMSCMIKIHKTRKGAIKVVFDKDKKKMNVSNLIAAKSFPLGRTYGVIIFKPIENKDMEHKDLVLLNNSAYAYVIDKSPDINGYILLEEVFGFFPMRDFTKIADKGAYEFYDKD